MKPGDRRQRWNSTCNIEIFIGFIIFLAGITGGFWPGAIIGGIVLYLALRDRKNGWKVSYRVPSWRKHQYREEPNGDVVDIETNKIVWNWKVKEGKG
jgi:hypothetical protein